MHIHVKEIRLARSASVYEEDFVYTCGYLVEIKQSCSDQINRRVGNKIVNQSWSEVFEVSWELETARKNTTKPDNEKNT